MPQYPLPQAHPALVEGVAFMLVHAVHRLACVQLEHSGEQAVHEVADVSGGVP